jgi:hypothetical protein
MVKQVHVEAQNKRVNVQHFFWNQVGAVEHLNLPKLEAALRKEFKNASGRFIESTDLFNAD